MKFVYNALTPIPQSPPKSWTRAEKDKKNPPSRVGRFENTLGELQTSA